VAGIGTSGVEEMADQEAVVTMMAISGRRVPYADSLIPRFARRSFDATPVYVAMSLL